MKEFSCCAPFELEGVTLTSAGTSASQLTATLTHHMHQFFLQNFSSYLFIRACVHTSIHHAFSYYILYIQ